MATLKQLSLQLTRKKEKAAKLTAEVKVLRGEMALIKEQVAALKATVVKPVAKKVAAKKPAAAKAKAPAKKAVKKVAKKAKKK